MSTKTVQCPKVEKIVKWVLIKNKNMKKQLLAITLAGTLIAPLGVFAEDLGGTPPPPPPDGGTFQPQPPMDGGGGFQQPQPQTGTVQQIPGGTQPFGGQPQQFGQQPQEGQFFPPQGGFQQGNFPQPFGQGKVEFPGGGSTGGQFPGQGTTGGQFPGGEKGQQGKPFQPFGQGQKPTPFFGQQGQEGGPTPFFGQQNQKQPTPFLKGEGKNETGQDGQPQQPQNPFGMESEGGEFEAESQEQDQGDYVDPQEIRQVQKQISDLKKQAQRLLTKTKKSTTLANETAEVQSFLTELANYATNIQGGTRDALQEFYDAELWEKMNGFQARIEMPTEISRMQKDLTRLEKLIAAKTFRVDGVDMDMVRSNIEEIRNAISGAKNALSSGDVESAREYLQTIYEGTNPGEMYGVLQQLKEITKQLKTVKNADVKQSIMEVLAPAYESVAAGDFREANMALSEINRELFSILGKLRNTRTVNTDLRTKMRALEQKLEGRIQQIETQGANQSGAYVPYQGAKSGNLGSLLSSVKDFFGL
ncbi:MAG: hypothetical protein Q8P01_05510 [bacterium]|nr:hypothetical protein [bacterium]